MKTEIIDDHKVRYETDAFLDTIACSFADYEESDNNIQGIFIANKSEDPAVGTFRGTPEHVSDLMAAYMVNDESFCRAIMLAVLKFEIYEKAAGSAK